MESDALGLLPGVDRSNVALVGEVAGGSSLGGGGFAWSVRGEPDAGVFGVPG